MIGSSCVCVCVYMNVWGERARKKKKENLLKQDFVLNILEALYSSHAPILSICVYHMGLYSPSRSGLINHNVAAVRRKTYVGGYRRQGKIDVVIFLSNRGLKKLSAPLLLGKPA